MFLPEEQPLSEVQHILYTAIVLFTVAASSVCLEKKIDGLPTRLVEFFECKVLCDKKKYGCKHMKIVEKFKMIPNHECSPYYQSFVGYKNMCKRFQKKLLEARKKWVTG